MPPVPIPSGLRPSPLDKGSRPLDPVLRGPPMREAGNHRKGAGGHWIGFRSITAAAERPVTFGWCFSWLEAHLLRGLGSSAAQRIGGRPSVPPLQNTGTIRSFRRGRSQTGPQAAKGRPTAENRPGALVRQRQARLWNRTNSNFPKTQGPVARKKSQKATQILRAGNVLPTPRGNPRNGGPRGNLAWRTRRYAEVLPCKFPLASFGSFSTGKRNSPRRANPL